MTFLQMILCLFCLKHGTSFFFPYKQCEISHISEPVSAGYWTLSDYYLQENKEIMVLF